MKTLIFLIALVAFSIANAEPIKTPASVGDACDADANFKAYVASIQSCKAPYTPLQHKDKPFLQAGSVIEPSSK